jgi:hypothetical protein
MIGMLINSKILIKVELVKRKKMKMMKNNLKVFYLPNIGNVNDLEKEENVE